jgi:hypothetical protein
MSIATINGIALRDDVIWVNEFEFNPTAYNQKYTLSGVQVLTAFSMASGDKMELDCRWITRATLQLLKALQSPDIYVLIMPDSRQLSVVVESIDSEPVIGYSDMQGGDLYQVTLKLIKV